MKKTLIALAVIAASGMAFASGGEGNNTNCNGKGNKNSPCAPVTPPANNGGNGGNGGNGIGVGIAGAASNAASTASSSASNHTVVGVVAGGGHSSATGGSASVGGVGNGLGNFSPKAEATIEKGAVANTVSPTATGNTGTIQGGSASTGAIDNKSSATAGSVGNVGSFSSVKSLSPESSSNSSIKDSGNATQGQLQGQNQGQSSVNVNHVSTKGTVGNVSSEVKNSGNSSSYSQGGTVKDSGNSTNVIGVSTKGTVGDVSTGSQTTSVGGQSTSIVMGDNDSTVAAAKLAADAQVEAARIAAETNGTRDITDAREQALNREAAIEIARIQQTVKNTPSVSGPALTSSNDTCMGSTSGSANAPGIGIGFGTSWVDTNCKMLKNSRELWNMGMKAASLALMCNDADNKAALELTGFECPQTTAAKKQVAADVSAQAAPMSTANGSVPYAGNDPIVRARHGMK